MACGVDSLMRVGNPNQARQTAIPGNEHDGLSSLA